MNLQEQITRIQSMMGVNEQTSAPKQIETPFWAKVADVFLPGTPTEDGVKILNDFSKIIQRRIDYNKKNNLPLDKMTPEEINFREKLVRATPNLNYPSLANVSKLISDIKSGKSIRQDELNLLTNPGMMSVTQPMSQKDAKELLNRREELKRMWMGVDEPGGENKGFWIKSEFKPKDSKNSNAIYYKPRIIPKLTVQQFDELYNEILKTKKPDGTFPGGNSDAIISSVSSGALKNVDANLIQNLTGDVAKSSHLMLGNFKLGASEENGKKYISIYDEWDLEPPIAKKLGFDIQKYGTIPLIYYRIYRQ